MPHAKQMSHPERELSILKHKLAFHTCAPSDTVLIETIMAQQLYHLFDATLQ